MRGALTALVILAIMALFLSPAIASPPHGGPHGHPGPHFAYHGHPGPYHHYPHFGVAVVPVAPPPVVVPYYYPYYPYPYYPAPAAGLYYQGPRVSVGVGF